jgi:hypothetical protein
MKLRTALAVTIIAIPIAFFGGTFFGAFLSHIDAQPRAAQSDQPPVRSDFSQLFPDFDQAMAYLATHHLGWWEHLTTEDAAWDAYDASKSLELGADEERDHAGEVTEALTAWQPQLTKAWEACMRHANGSGNQGYTYEEPFQSTCPELVSRYGNVRQAVGYVLGIRRAQPDLDAVRAAQQHQVREPAVSSVSGDR